MPFPIRLAPALLALVPLALAFPAAPVAAGPDDPAGDPPAPLSVTVTGPALAGPGAADAAPAAGGLTAEFFRCYPALLERFDDPADPAPRAITLVLKPRLRVPAYCAGDTITVSARWLRDHPEDLALLTHELTHAVQRYPNPGDGRERPGWLVEGLADYARQVYGPDRQPGWSLPARLTDRNNYTDGYRVTARFLVWLDEKHPGAVDALHESLRAGAYTDAVFKTAAGAPVADLWARCVADLSAADGRR